MHRVKPVRRFMIRNKSTGEFSTGGSHPRWSVSGKIWNGIGPLKSHLKTFKRYHQHGRALSTMYNFYDDAEIVEIKLEIAGSPCAVWDDLTGI